MVKFMAALLSLALAGCSQENKPGDASSTKASPSSPSGKANSHTINNPYGDGGYITTSGDNRGTYYDNGGNVLWSYYTNSGGEFRYKTPDGWTGMLNADGTTTWVNETGSQTYDGAGNLINAPALQVLARDPATQAALEQERDQADADGSLYREPGTDFSWGDDPDQDEDEDEDYVSGGQAPVVPPASNSASSDFAGGQGDEG